MQKKRRMSKTILITGGAGFIGSHVVRLFVNKYPDYKIVNLDVLTYAGNLENLRDIENKENYIFEKGDIVDEGYIKELFAKYNFDGVVHLAAESHVDRSITNPMEFIMTNVVGTVNLLNAAKNHWKGNEEGKLFYKYGINVEEENRKLFRGFREEKFYRMSMKRYHIQESFNIPNIYS